MKLKMVLIGVFVVLSLHAQDVTDTLGYKGKFQIKDSVSNNLLTVTDEGNMTVAGTITVNNGSTSYTLPAADGTESQVLKTDGKGTVSWDSPLAAAKIKFLICVKGMYPVHDGEMDEHFLGEIIMFAGQDRSVPGNFLECRGQELQVNEYMALYSIIGTTYGGDGIRTFNLPNLSGYVPQGQ